MANFIRLAKSGNEWSTNELMVYNITIIERDQNTFLNSPLPTSTGLTSFIQYEDGVQGLNVSSLALIKRLDLTIKVMDGEELAVDDFTTEIFHALGYKTEQTIIHMCKNIQLSMCRQQVYTKTDVYIMGINSALLLLAQEDKS
jgi:hypothetical protein